jgi:hypothetical protein
MADSHMTALVVSKLKAHLGPRVASMSIDMFARKVGVPRDQLTATHLPGLLADLRPMLNVMIGKGPAEAVVSEIERMTPEM